MHCLTHGGVVFQASINSRVLFVGTFPTTEAVKPVVRQKGIPVLSLEGSLVFLHARGKLTASVAYIGAGAPEARGDIYDIQPPLR